MADSISAADPHPRRQLDVLDSTMSVLDTGGSGPNVVFLHGNPTSSYLWRNIIEVVKPHGRCLAPDLIGMGNSGPNPAGSYRFVDHAKYLSACLDALDLDGPVVLVLHDWGSALGFDWARQHPDRVAGLVYMEAIVTPVEWEDWNDAARPIFEAFRSPAGEEMILQKNIFVERVLPGSILRSMSDEEMNVYRKPWLESGESRRPMLTWPREIPLAGSPADVVDRVQMYADWLKTSPLPKLFINAEPGAILIKRQREFCRTWPNQTEITVKGSHFIQEDSPKEIGEAIIAFLNEHGL